MASASPQAHRFAVAGAAGDRLRAAGFDHVERASDDVAVVTLPPRQAAPKAAWRELLDRAGGIGWAAPVLVDEQGEEQVPTGELTVRFATAPDDESLAAFASRHALVLRRRNEFVAEQAVFAPADARSAYLPELCEELAGDPAVAHAWANTLSRYRRA